MSGCPASSRWPAGGPAQERKRTEGINSSTYVPSAGANINRKHGKGIETLEDYLTKRKTPPKTVVWEYSHTQSQCVSTHLLELLLLEGGAHALEQAHPRVGRRVFLQAVGRPKTTVTKESTHNDRGAKERRRRWGVSSVQHALHADRVFHQLERRASERRRIGGEARVATSQHQKGVDSKGNKTINAWVWSVRAFVRPYTLGVTTRQLELKAVRDAPAPPTIRIAGMGFASTPCRVQPCGKSLFGCAPPNFVLQRTSSCFLPLSTSTPCFSEVFSTALQTLVPAS